MPHVDVGHGGEGDDTKNDNGYEGQEHEDQHLTFAERETHVWRSFLAPRARLVCAILSAHTKKCLNNE